MEWFVYKSNRLNPESEIAFKKLSKKNQEAMTKWLFEKEINSKAEKRGANRRRAIIKFLSFVKKDYDKITYDDIVQVASAISKSKCGVNLKNDDKNFITRFLKDTHPDYQARFKGLTIFKSEKQKDNEKITARDLLTESDLDKLMKATSDMKKTALISTLYFSGARPEEILKLKWCDIDFKKQMVYLYSSKTGRKRAVPIGVAVQHLTRLKEETGATQDDLIFPSINGKIMTIAGLNYQLQQLGEKAKLNKRIWAYLFRHTRLSYLITKLSPKVYEEVAGHSLSMGMSTYSHLSQDQVIKEMNEKVFEVKKLSENEENELKKRVEVLENYIAMMSKRKMKLYLDKNADVKKDDAEILKELSKLPIVNNDF